MGGGYYAIEDLEGDSRPPVVSMAPHNYLPVRGMPGIPEDAGRVAQFPVDIPVCLQRRFRAALQGPRVR